MTQGPGAENDSRYATGGEIPGSPGAPAWYLRCPQPSALPVLLAVPHAGRAYPDALLERMRNPGYAALRLEDRYVDLLAEEVARITGAALLVAQAPRAMIDLNRDVHDVDWGMFGDGLAAEAPGHDLGSYAPELSGQPMPPSVRRAKSGLGLIPRRLPGMGELWKRRHAPDELAARIAGIHAPYHQQLAGQLAALRARWGAALLVDLHSMPPLGVAGGPPGPEFVLGDRFGASCDGGLVASAFAHYACQRRTVAHNRPYAGGYVLERHAAPHQGLHALQIEIDRSCYLDTRLTEPGAGFAGMVRVLAELVTRLAAEVAALGAAQDDSPGHAHWAEAAE